MCDTEFKEEPCQTPRSIHFSPIATVFATIRMRPPPAAAIPPKSGAASVTAVSPDGAQLPTTNPARHPRSSLIFWTWDDSANQSVERSYACYRVCAPYPVLCCQCRRRLREGRRKQAAAVETSDTGIRLAALGEDVRSRFDRWSLLRGCCRASRPGVRVAVDSQLS
jgi:hypothetical protein